MDAGPELESWGAWGSEGNLDDGTPAPPATAPTWEAAQNAQVQYVTYEPGVSGKAIASLVLGVMSVVSCACYGLPGIVLGPLALLFGLLAREDIYTGGQRGNEMRIAGMICGAVGTLIALCVFGIFGIAILGSVL